MSYVTITKGAEDWRIYQQKNGYADIEIEGERQLFGPNDHTWLRVVSEDDMTTVVDWTKAQETDGIDKKLFKITLHVPAGGLYRIDTTVAGGLQGIDWSAQGQKIYHVGVGDLFIIAGQSNSAGYGRTPVSDPPELGVHLCKNSEEWSLAMHPMNDPHNTKHTANYEATSGHSPYLAFGKMMKKHLGYPIGLIQESLGGSPLSRWNKRLDGSLYNSMVESVRRCTDGKMEVAGVLWYQGCSDANNNDAPLYFERFAEMVGDMRADFKSPDLPIYTVQLNKVLDYSNDFWAVIRETQRMAPHEIENVFVVPAADLGLNDGIHNSSASNIVIGERLARVALEGYYKKNVYGFAPEIESAVYDGKTVTLTFAHVHQYIQLCSVPVHMQQFVIEDESGVVPSKSYSASLNKLFFEPERPLCGKMTVSFLKTANPSPNLPLDVGSGLPLLAFDNFEIKNA